MKKAEIKNKAKDLIQEALATAYYKIADNPSGHDLTEEEAEEVIKAMNSICEQLCKRMGRKHYTL